jgi:hypothetical protein
MVAPQTFPAGQVVWTFGHWVWLTGQTVNAGRHIVGVFGDWVVPQAVPSGQEVVITGHCVACGRQSVGVLGVMVGPQVAAGGQ